MGGVFASVAMIVALACKLNIFCTMLHFFEICIAFAGSSGPSNSAFIFFLVAIVVLFLTIIAYILLTRLVCIFYCIDY